MSLGDALGRIWFAVGIATTLALTALTVLAISGVVLSRVEEVPGTPGGTLRVVAVAPPGELDPARVRTAFGVSLLRATLRTPYAFEPGRGVVPDLALGPPEISGDSRQLEITLRSGVRFAPPVDREVTADDVAYAIERGFLPGVDSGAAQLYFGDIEGIAAFRSGEAERISGMRTTGEHTLLISLERPTGRSVASALTLPIAAPVPREHASRFDTGSTTQYARHLVATGPYRIERRPDGSLPPASAQRLTLVRNPNWEAGTDFRAAFADRIVVTPAADREVGSRDVLRGASSISGDFAAPADVLRLARDSRPEQVRLTQAGAIRYIALNTTVSPLDDVEVRRAVTAAFDRAAARRALGGRVVGPLATHWIPPGVPGYDEANGSDGFGLDFLSLPRGDARLAHAYMRAAGYPSGRYTGSGRLLAIGARERDSRKIGELARRSFRRLGIGLELRFLEPDRALSRCSDLRRTPAVCLDGGWVKDFDDAGTVLEPLFFGEAIRRRANDNWSLLDDPVVNEAIDAAATTTGAADRAEEWADADRAITNLAPAVPLVWDRYPLLRSTDVRGVVDRDLGQWDLSFTSLR